MHIIDFFTEFPLRIILALFVIFTLIQLIYYLGVYAKILFHKDSSKEESGEIPVSVIICARNEEENLNNNLPAILEQDYKNFEVVVVNDASTDNSDLVLKKYAQKYPHLKTTEIKKDQKFTHGKKLAVTIGVKAAKNEWLLFTDADCYPVTKNWIKQMAGNFDEKTSIVLGYGGYKKYKSALNTLIRYDTVIIALQYLTYALSGFPYMGVGRNMAYRKSLFFKNKGFAKHYHVDSGDDDIFINQTARKENTKIEINPDSIIRSEPNSSWSSWFKQKMRHLTSASYYNRATKFRLFFEVLSRELFYATFALSLIFFTKYYLYIIGVFFIRYLIQLIIFGNIMKRFNENYLLLVSLFYDLFIPLINFIAIISNKITSKNTKWN